MEKLQTTPLEELNNITNSILRSIEIHTKLFGQDRFSRSVISKDIHRRLNSALFEVWVVILSGLTPLQIENIYKNQVALKNEYKQLFGDKSFNDAVTTSTASRNAVINRFTKIESLIKKYII